MGSRQIVAKLRRRERGAALLVMLMIIVTGASWMMVSALNASSSRAAPDREHNARVLSEAKAALIGWIASTALEATENNPGRLPCPQAWGDVGSSNEGRAAGVCAQPAVGWLPWRTLGLPVMRDAAGRQLWYAISPDWHLPNGGTTLTVNSNTAGQLSLNGQAAVALIIAPGSALNLAPNAAQLAAGCVARSQSQALNLPTTPPNVLDFLECDNGSSGDDSFTATVVNNATNAVINDQVLAVTTADVLPVLEAAISKRIERDIVPQLLTVFAGPNWGLPAGSRLYPFAAPFADPGPGAGTSNYQGAVGNYQGLLPFNQIQCTADPANPRCLPALVAWSSTPATYQASSGHVHGGDETCSWDTPDMYTCEGWYHQDGGSTAPGMIIGMTAQFSNVAMGLRALDATKVQVYARNDAPDPWITLATNASATLNVDGSATATVNGQLPNTYLLGTDRWSQYKISLERQIIDDHALLDSTNATTGWFVRNEWFRLLYYATAQTHTAANLPSTPACTTGTNCLRLRTLPGGATDWDKRAVLVVAGRANSNQTRPSTLSSEYVEFDNDDGGTRYTRAPIRTVINATLSAPFNDRVVVVDTN